MIAEWRVNPCQFVTDVFRATPSKWQAEALDAITQYDKISIRSGHGVGKTTFDSWLIFWFLTCFYPCKIPCTAPSAPQLHDILWAELSLWHQRMQPALRKYYEYQDMRLHLVGARENAFAVARTARAEKPEALQGFHSENLLFVIDEASGVEEPVFTVAEGALSTPGAKVVMTSNPTRTSGYFYDSHHKMAHLWQRRVVSCVGHERVSPEYVDNMAIKYGDDSDVYRVRVLGEFPQSESDTVIPLQLIEAAAERDVEPLKTVMPVWGLDVARFGTCRTALVRRWGNQVTRAQTWRKRDTMEVAGIVMFEYEECESDQKPAVILVDAIGLGAGVVDRLRELGLPVVGINVGEQASGKKRYMNLRAELWWRAREWFEDRTSRMTDAELGAELSIVRYKFNSTGRIQIESKEDMMDRGVDSPDLADAFVLTFSGADRRKETHDRYDRKKTIKSTAWAA